MTGRDKARENLARRRADRQGLGIHKSRQRDPQGLEFGKWLIVDREGVTHEFDDIEGVEAYLDGKP